MKKYFILYFSFLLILMFFVGCDKNINTSDDSVSFEPSVNCYIEDGVFFVELGANYTTGYEWSYNITDDTIIKCELAKYYPYEHEEYIVGTGGIYKASFSALKDGETNIIFIYKRSWEEDDIKTITKKVIVNNNIIVSFN